nr:hypothetical protein [Tanacetum cinerariifolium]
MKYKNNQMRTNPLPRLGEGIYTPFRTGHVGFMGVQHSLGPFLGPISILRALAQFYGTTDTLRVSYNLPQREKKQKSRRKQRKEIEVPSPSREIPTEEGVPTTSNDPLPSGVDRMQLKELMILCTNIQKQVLDSEEAKSAQAKEIVGFTVRAYLIGLAFKKSIICSNPSDSVGLDRNATKLCTSANFGVDIGMVLMIIDEIELGFVFREYLND